MVFYISALLHFFRIFEPGLQRLSPQIVAMGAISSALFYCIMRWPVENKKSPYLFASFYGLLLSGGAYVIQSFQFAQVTLHWNGFWVGLLLTTLLAVVFYSPHSLRERWGLGLRRYYLVKPMVVSWCWTIWALMPLIFIQPSNLLKLMLISFLFVFSLVLMTEIIDVQVDENTKTMATMWGEVVTLICAILCLILSEILIGYFFESKIAFGKLMLAGLLPVFSLFFRRKYLSALLVDGALIMFYFLI